MWGNLAGRISQVAKDADLRGAMANIADVVAPPPNDSDEESEYEEVWVDEEEEEEEEEQYEEEETEEEEESEPSKVFSFSTPRLGGNISSKSPIIKSIPKLSVTGLISRWVDQDPQEQQDQYQHKDTDFDQQDQYQDTESPTHTQTQQIIETAQGEAPVSSDPIQSSSSMDDNNNTENITVPSPAFRVTKRFERKPLPSFSKSRFKIPERKPSTKLIIPSKTSSLSTVEFENDDNDTHKPSNNEQEKQEQEQQKPDDQPVQDSLDKANDYDDQNEAIPAQTISPIQPTESGNLLENQNLQQEQPPQSTDPDLQPQKHSPVLGKALIITNQLTQELVPPQTLTPTPTHANLAKENGIPKTSPEVESHAVTEDEQKAQDDGVAVVDDDHVDDDAFLVEHEDVIVDDSQENDQIVQTEENDGNKVAGTPIIPTTTPIITSSSPTTSISINSGSSHGIPSKSSAFEARIPSATTSSFSSFRREPSPIKTVTNTAEAIDIIDDLVGMKEEKPSDTVELSEPIAAEPNPASCGDTEVPPPPSDSLVVQQQDEPQEASFEDRAEESHTHDARDERTETKELSSNEAVFSTVPSQQSSHITDHEIAEKMNKMNIQNAELEAKCRSLQDQLDQREYHILELEQDAAKRIQEEIDWRQKSVLQSKQHQAELLEANTESITAEWAQKVQEMQNVWEEEYTAVQQELLAERQDSAKQLDRLKQQLKQAQSRVESLQADSKLALSQQHTSATKRHQQTEREKKHAEEKLAETRALLDDRMEENKVLKSTLKEVRTAIRQAENERKEFEEEIAHLREENDTLHHNWQVTEEETEEIKKQLEESQEQNKIVQSLRQEIQELQSDREREHAAKVSLEHNAQTDRTKIEADRDEAMARARDLEQQLTAALADVQVAKSDTDRVMLANANLNRALESFQSERDAEMALMEEQRKSSEEALSAAHAATLQAATMASEQKLRQVQQDANLTVTTAKQQVKELEEMVISLKEEKMQTRRSLDEAIRRLQASQEDVIDRSLMKNVILDWFGKTGKNKRDVLQVMASLLHMTEDEKQQCQLHYEANGSGAFSNVVHAVAAPLPPAAKDVKSLEGSNVRDKFINFLMAETDD